MINVSGIVKALTIAAMAIAVAGYLLFSNVETNTAAVSSAEEEIQLSDASYGVTANFTDTPEEPMIPMMKLVDLTEEELFSRYNTTILRGTVVSIRNIELTAGEVHVYKALLTIKPSKVYRGPSDETVTVLANCPIDGSFRMEDTETVSAIRTGMEGIFMLQPYTDADMWELDGAALRWKDIAQYGFPDGRRYAFLATPSGLLYAEWAYPSMTGASTLDDVERVILQKIQ